MTSILCRLGWHRKRNLVAFAFGSWVECGACGRRVYR